MSKYKEIALQSLRTEIKGLESVLNNSINDTFDKVINVILKTKGRIILTAVGKPAYLAHRAAATLSSTGTIAYYVHANEASHGDMGMIDKKDTVIMISNSGESKELNDIIAYCKRFDIKLIGITRNPNGFLAKSASIPVILENVEQTNKVNSPTTSEIMFLAYLDAIATVLIEIKHFDKDKYKIFHPGGKLGAKLLKVEELMYKQDKLPLVSEEAIMKDAIDIMIKKPIGCLLAVDKHNKFKGIITDGDFKRKLIKYPNLMDKKIKDIMTKTTLTITKDMYVTEALNIMRNGIGQNNNYIQVLPVTEKQKVIGLLHIQDCLKSGLV